MIFLDELGGNVEIDFVIGEGETEAARLTFAADDASEAGELRDEELIIVDNGVIAIQKRKFFASEAFGELL